jgi:hypothetical protein
MYAEGVFLCFVFSGVAAAAAAGAAVVDVGVSDCDSDALKLIPRAILAGVTRRTRRLLLLAVELVGRRVGGAGARFAPSIHRREATGCETCGSEVDKEQNRLSFAADYLGKFKFFFWE